MVFLYLVALIGLCLWGLRISGYRQDYIAKDQTDALKGIFAILIVFSHMRSYMGANTMPDRLFSQLFTLLGQMLVVIFFFSSGFGIMESLNRKPNYEKGFFKKRILKLLLDYNLVVLLYMLLHTCSGTYFSAERYLLSWCGWESVVSVQTQGNWFLFVILQLYLITLLGFFLFRAFKNRKCYGWLVFGFTFVLSIGLMVFLWQMGREEYWYNTLLVYSFGMLYSLFRKPIEAAMKKPVVYGTAMLAVCAGAGAILLLGLKDVVSYSIMGCFFALFLVFLCMHVKIQNPVLIWLGKLSFSIYILQRLPMTLFAELGLAAMPELYAGVCIAATLLLAQLHNSASKKLGSLVL